jgi:plastocyanin
MIRYPGWPWRVTPLVVSIPLVALLIVSPGCSEDPPSGPQIDRTIRILDTTFIPSNTTIQVGQRVEWQNRSQEDRTVTSGTGADDPSAGGLFDVQLDGYPPGDAIGGRYTRQFTEPDTIYYFSRKVPNGYSGDFLGVLIVAD